MEKATLSNHQGHEKVLNEVHAYSYNSEDKEVGSKDDGFYTARMKNTAFIPSSAV